MVQQQQQQLQYNETGLGGVPSSEVRIRILVGEKGRLGCGVCRGIVPGLTVQVNSILIGYSLCHVKVTWAFLRFFPRYHENSTLIQIGLVLKRHVFNSFLIE